MPTFLRSTIPFRSSQLRKEGLFDDVWDKVIENMQWKMEQFGADALIHY